MLADMKENEAKTVCGQSACIESWDSKFIEIWRDVALKFKGISVA